MAAVPYAYTALEPITVGGALAFAVGDHVPAETVEALGLGVGKQVEDRDAAAVAEAVEANALEAAAINASAVAAVPPAENPVVQVDADGSPAEEPKAKKASASKP